MQAGTVSITLKRLSEHTKDTEIEFRIREIPHYNQIPKIDTTDPSALEAAVTRHENRLKKLETSIVSNSLSPDDTPIFKMLGRGPLLMIRDTKCSRRQLAIMAVSSPEVEARGTVYVQRLGPNASFVRRVNSNFFSSRSSSAAQEISVSQKPLLPDSNENFFELQWGSLFEIKTGDVLCLQTNEPFVVSIEWVPPPTPRLHSLASAASKNSSLGGREPSRKSEEKTSHRRASSSSPTRLSPMKSTGHHWTRENSESSLDSVGSPSVKDWALTVDPDLKTEEVRSRSGLSSEVFLENPRRLQRELEKAFNSSQSDDDSHEEEEQRLISDLPHLREKPKNKQEERDDGEEEKILLSSKRVRKGKDEELFPARKHQRKGAEEQEQQVDQLQFFDQSIAIPMLGCGVFMLDEKMVASTLASVIGSFLDDHPISENPDILIRLVGLKNLSGHSPIAKLMKKDPRVSCIRGDITKLRSTLDSECRFIVNSCNNTLSPNGSGLNLAIFQAANIKTRKKLVELIQAITKKTVPDEIDPGQVYPLSLPKDSPLRTKEGVEFILNVLSPNLNPARPNCTTKKEASKLLHTCYSDIVDMFWRFASSSVSQKLTSLRFPFAQPSLYSSSSPSSSPSPPFTEKSLLVPSKKLYNAHHDEITSPAASSSKATPKPAGAGFWKNALLDYLDRPQDFPESEVVMFNESMVIIKDKFPKATHHYLLMPRERISDLTSLDPSRVALLTSMRRFAQRFTQKLMKEDVIEFRMGFHAVPSMNQLHLHIISSDFNSDSLKNKKHWNSFNTAYFIEIKQAIELLSAGPIFINKEQYEKLLSSALKCHICDATLGNMPLLKKHILSCKK